MERPRHFSASYLRSYGGLDRDRGEKLLAEMLRQRRGGMFGGRHPALGGMGGHAPSFPGSHPMMGGYTQHGFPPPMGPPPMGMMGLGGMGRMGGMPMGMSMGMGMGMGRGMGMNPHIGMGGMGMGGMGTGGMGIGGMGMGYGRPPLGHSPFGQRHSRFGLPSAGPPRAHSFLPQPCHSYSPFARPRPSPFSSRTMFDEFDDYEEDFSMPPRRGFGQPRRSSSKFAPQQQYPRRRGYHPPPSMFEYEESDDHYDEYDDYEDDEDDEDEFQDYIPRQSPYMRLRGY